MLWAVIGINCAIFGGLIAGLTLQLRDRLRDGVLRREAEAIHAVALMQLGRDSDLAQFGAEFVLDDMFAAVLESAALRGVLAVQLFDAQGRLRQARPLPPEDAVETRGWVVAPAAPTARFVATGTLEMVSPQLAVESRDLGRLPLVEIIVPLHLARGGGAALGVARYWMDGAPVAQEFARMDRRLIVQAGAAFGSGALLLALVLGWAFARLGEAQRQLEAQRSDLARANEELDFAAKTGALGAISAHLIHGLKNPLAGLEGFVAETASSGADAVSGEACRSAMETTRRLRLLVNEVTTVLRDETGTADYPVPIREVLDAARHRVAAAAEQAGVNLQVNSTAEVAVTARTANLAGLVLANLATNAIEASRRGTTVTVEGRAEAGAAVFVVRDQGPGLPLAVQAGLFRPVRSSKRGGGGVGLAISLRLAKHAGGNLELVRSGPAGAEFRLSVPVGPSS